MTLIDRTPAFSVADAERITKEFYSVYGEISKLPSERDQNFLISSINKIKYVLKISNGGENLEFLEAQNYILLKLLEGGVTCPKVVASLANQYVEEVKSSNGSIHYIRLVTYLEGKPYARLAYQPEDLFSQIGSYLGRLDRNLDLLDHPALHRIFQWDIKNGPVIVNKYAHLVQDSVAREFIRLVKRRYPKLNRNSLKQLRKGIIHNDLNDHNLIVQECNISIPKQYKVVGGIDFGDIVYSYTVSDLAVAIAYAILDKADPLAIAATIVKSYHQEYPLTEDEISVLFDMVCMRLCVSMCLAAYHIRIRPEDDYFVISQKPIRNTLPKLMEIHPRFAEASFREVCGFDPVPKISGIEGWVYQNQHSFTPIFGEPFSPGNCVGVSLEVDSPLLMPAKTGTQDYQITNNILDLLEDQEVLFGVGRYAEPKINFPLTNQYTNDFQDSWVHLGINLYARSSTPVFTVSNGIVYEISQGDSIRSDNDVVIIQHETDQGEYFYTLYRGLQVDQAFFDCKGTSVPGGTKIGFVKGFKMYGNDLPGIQFQLIIDDLNLKSLFPNIMKTGHSSIWRCFSSDPRCILNIPDGIFPFTTINKTETLKKRQKLIGRNLSLGYHIPVKIVRGWMQYLFDQKGMKYLDAYNNVPHVGHCHPRVVEAGVRQSSILNTNTRYLHDNILQYAEKLLSTFPPSMDVCFFVNSGSEANELALRLARTHTKATDIIVLSDAYHGNTTTLIDISPYKHNGPGGYSPPDWVHTIPVPDVYRGPHRSSGPDAAEKYSGYARDAVVLLKNQNRELSCFIAETCPSVGGQIFLPDGYLKRTYQYVRSAGGICIADEVQTGYGRIGTHFYAFEAHDVVPDIVVLGKPIGNGHPIGVVVTTSEIASSFDNGMEFFSTFGGNPVSCAIGISVLEVVQEVGLQEHALDVGNHLLCGLRDVIGSHPIVGDVRGSGLFIGVELVRDSETLEPADKEADFIINQMRTKGILLGTDGPYHNVVKIRPPMPFDRNNAIFLIETFAQVLREHF